MMEKQKKEITWKTKMRKLIIPGFLLLLVFGSTAMTLTGSAGGVPATSGGIAEVAVIDERGVGQTQKEAEKGMNCQVIYSEESNALWWDLGSDYKLTDGYTYYITFKVEDGQLVREKYRLVDLQKR